MILLLLVSLCLFSEIVTSSRLFSEPLCSAQTRWSTVDEAKDIADQTVKVSPVFFVGKVAIKQNFYISTCADESKRCRPLDEDIALRYRCETTYGYTYAYIQKDVTDWGMIRLPVGCHCLICSDFEQEQETSKFLW